MWYDIDVPIGSKLDDYVSYRVQYNEKIKPSGLIKSDYLHVACYYEHMKMLTGLTITCIPNPPAGALPFDIFCRWIDLCKKAGIVVDDAEPFQENGNCLRLPGTGHSRHEVYASLCCYRWAENTAQLPYTVVKLAELSSLPIHQILHYAMAKYVRWVNHSFSSIHAKCSLTFYNQYKHTFGYYLMHGVAMARFFVKENGKSVADKENQTAHTNTVINKAVMEFPAIPDSSVLCVNRIENILCDAWEPIYSLKIRDKNEIVSLYNETMKTLKDSA